MTPCKRAFVIIRLPLFCIYLLAALSLSWLLFRPFGGSHIRDAIENGFRDAREDIPEMFRIIRGRGEVECGTR